MQKRQKIFWALLVVISGYLIFSLMGKQGWIALYQNHLRYNKLSSDIRNAHQIIDSLRTDSIRLVRDTTYIERIAREKLGMAAKDEKIYKFVKENR